MKKEKLEKCIACFKELRPDRKSAISVRNVLKKSWIN